MSFSSAAGGGVYLPASSTEKSAPHAAKRISLSTGPWQSSIEKLGVGKGPAKSKESKGSRVLASKEKRRGLGAK